MECCVALGEVNQVDPRPVVAPQEARGSLRHSSKDASKVTKRDPDKEQQHRERPTSNERLLCATSTLTTEHTSQHEHSNPSTIERRDWKQVQDRKVGGEECGDLEEAAEPEPFSRASNSNGNANGASERWRFAVRAERCTHQFR
jgi:hypothetical protein